MKYGIKIIIVALLGLALGCSKPNHVAEHAANVAHDADYAADMEACYQKAIAEYHDGGTFTRVNADYESCAKMADNVAGRK